MATKKFFPTSSSRLQSEISLVYQSVTESTLGSGLVASPRGHNEPVGNHCASNSWSTSGVAAGQKTLKLGGNSKLGGSSTGRTTRTRVRLICLLRAPSSFIAKVKEQYALWKDGARSANIRVSDLFVANQIFMHMQTTPITNRRKQQGLNPSVGFVTRVEVPSAGGQREMRER